MKDFFDTEKELQPVRESINELVDKVAEKLYHAGKIKGYLANSFYPT